VCSSDLDGHFKVTTEGSERLRVNSSGQVGIGTTSPATVLDITKTSAGADANHLVLKNESSTSGTTVSLYLQPNDSSISRAAAIKGINPGSAGFANATELAFFTQPEGNDPAERCRIDKNGRLLVGTTNKSAFHILNRPSATQGDTVLYVGFALFGSALFFECNSGFYNVSATAIQVCKNTSTNRSINAGGTVNANGADYAEYMAKGGDFTIAKGDICGIDPDGKLTTNFADSVSYVVKSTDPSYVGGDTWGTEDAIGAKPAEDEPESLAEWESALEAARQKVDRIAFSGQIPVNVTGATPGQYIIPIEDADGGITGIAKDESDLTLTEYMRAVGKVIAIEDDGRARIIVKVA
jgi:hypothetical protein